MGGSEGGGSPDGSQTVPVWIFSNPERDALTTFRDSSQSQTPTHSSAESAIKVGGSPLNKEQIAGRRVFFVDGDALAACFETGLDEAFVKALAARAPLRVVFRDDGYASDALKINIDQIFKVHSPHTELKTL